MPTYEYECEECKHCFEEFQSLKAKPLSKCPRCGGKVRRLIGKGAGLIFKGSGFYITDYTRKNSPEVSKSSDAPAKKKTETAPAEKTSDAKENK